jgi:serine/threonine-protein kinase
VSQGTPNRERQEAQEFIDDLSPELLNASDRFPVASVVHGAAGVAAAYLELAVSRDNARDLESADLWSMRALRASHLPGGFESRELELTAERIGACSVHYGAPGVDLVRARVAQAMGDSRGLAEAVDALAPLATQQAATELAMGKAGLLLGAALILDDRPDEDAGDETSRRAIASVRAFGEQSLQEIFRAEGSRKHLGMAHGLGGELYASLVWSEVSATPPAPGVLDQLELLASLARSHGRGLRWPTQPPPAPTAYFESWCHGTPGHVLLWTTAARIVGDDYMTLADRAAMTVADTEAVNATLCCGAAGRAYAFLAMYRSTGERVWLTRARAQAARAWRIRDAVPSPISLLQGALSPAVLLLTIDDPDRCTFPMLERWR